MAEFPDGAAICCIFCARKHHTILQRKHCICGSTTGRGRSTQDDGNRDDGSGGLFEFGGSSTPYGVGRSKNTTGANLASLTSTTPTTENSTTTAMHQAASSFSPPLLSIPLAFGPTHTDHVCAMCGQEGTSTQKCPVCHHVNNTNGPEIEAECNLKAAPQGDGEDVVHSTIPSTINTKKKKGKKEKKRRQEYLYGKKHIRRRRGSNTSPITTTAKGDSNLRSAEEFIDDSFVGKNESKWIRKKLSDHGYEGWYTLPEKIKPGVDPAIRWTAYYASMVLFDIIKHKNWETRRQRDREDNRLKWYSQYWVGAERFLEKHKFADTRINHTHGGAIEMRLSDSFAEERRQFMRNGSNLPATQTNVSEDNNDLDATTPIVASNISATTTEQQQQATVTRQWPHPFSVVARANPTLPVIAPPNNAGIDTSATSQADLTGLGTNINPIALSSSDDSSDTSTAEAPDNTSVAEYSSTATSPGCDDSSRHDDSIDISTAAAQDNTSVTEHSRSLSSPGCDDSPRHDRKISVSTSAALEDSSRHENSVGDHDVYDNNIDDGNVFPHDYQSLYEQLLCTEEERKQDEEQHDEEQQEEVEQSPIPDLFVDGGDDGSDDGGDGGGNGGFDGSDDGGDGGGNGGFDGSDDGGDGGGNGGFDGSDDGGDGGGNGGGGNGGMSSEKEEEQQEEDGVEEEQQEEELQDEEQQEQHDEEQQEEGGNGGGGNGGMSSEEEEEQQEEVGQNPIPDLVVDYTSTTAALEDEYFQMMMRPWL
jgi:hypothetical protein